MAQPITAAPEVAPRDGLAGALGYGLIVPDPGTDPLDPTNRWNGPGGYALEGLACGRQGFTDSGEFCDPHALFAGALTPFYAALDEQRPFVVGAAVACSTLGAPADLIAAFRDRAERALALSQWPMIADELWTGARSDAMSTGNRRLASPEADVLTVEPVSLVEGIAALEDAFSDCSSGDVQVIHGSRKLGAYLSAANVIYSTPGSGRIFTANNALVVLDRGYPGTDPDGAVPEPGVTWLYSTGPLSARLGPIMSPESDLSKAVNAASNRGMVRAQRQAAIAWLCCHLAIPVRYSTSDDVIESA